MGSRLEVLRGVGVDPRGATRPRKAAPADRVLDGKNHGIWFTTLQNSGEMIIYVRKTHSAAEGR